MVRKWNVSSINYSWWQVTAGEFARRVNVFREVEFASVKTGTSRVEYIIDVTVESFIIISAMEGFKFAWSKDVPDL